MGIERAIAKLGLIGKVFPETRVIVMIDLFFIPEFLNAADCKTLQEELRSGGGSSATVTGGGQSGAAVEAKVRKASKIDAPQEWRERINALLRARVPEIAAHFHEPVDECEGPHFLKYATGDFFVAHQDGNTPLVYDDTRFRKISVIIFLSAPSTEPMADGYGGGELVFHGAIGGGEKRSVLEPPGTLVAFRAQTTHEVLPVTHGERYTIVAWLRKKG